VGILAAGYEDLDENVCNSLNDVSFTLLAAKPFRPIMGKDHILLLNRSDRSVID